MYVHPFGNIVSRGFLTPILGTSMVLFQLKLQWRELIVCRHFGARGTIGKPVAHRKGKGIIMDTGVDSVVGLPRFFCQVGEEVLYFPLPNNGWN